jgi:hypothetical protein
MIRRLADNPRAISACNIAMAALFVASAGPIAFDIAGGIPAITRP